MTSTRADTDGGGIPPQHNGTAIRCLREMDGYSQEALAGLAGLTQGGLSRIESGEKSSTAPTLNRIARALTVPLAAIVRGEGRDVPVHNGIAIRCFREKRGHSQSALARLAGVDQGALSRIESEETSPTALTVARLAAALSVPVAAVLRDAAAELARTAELVAL